MTSDKSIKDILSQLNKDYENVATTGDQYPKAEFISSGVYKFDAVTGGGFARGHMTEVHGLEGSGKTTLCVQAIAHAQSLGYTCALVNAERRFDTERAEELGVDLKKLILLHPKYGEQACDIMRDLIDSGEIDLLILDSLPALSSRFEMESTDGGAQPGTQAKMWSTFIRKIIPGFDNKKTAFVVINQMKLNLAINPYAPGAKDFYVFPGGQSQKYHSSNRIEIKKLEKASEFGFKVKFRSVKTSFTKPFMEMETFFDWEKGFSIEADILEMAIDKGIITKDGASYSMDGEKIAHGQKKMRELMEDDNFAEKLKGRLAS